VGVNPGSTGTSPVFQVARQFDTHFPLARSELGELFEAKKFGSPAPALNIEVEVGAFSQLQYFVYLALS